MEKKEDADCANARAFTEAAAAAAATAAAKSGAEKREKSFARIQPIAYTCELLPLQYCISLSLSLFLPDIHLINHLFAHRDSGSE